MNIYDDQSEYFPDVISLYVYKLSYIEDKTFEIVYIKPINISNWIAEKHNIKNWSYKRIMLETPKAILIRGDEWIAKSQIEFGDEVKEGDEYYRTHKNYIKEQERNLAIN